jgi:ABC-type transport system involved in multi-copper enzyme maturation permease subunit
MTTMWLLLAELRKLVRPLVWGTILAVASVLVLLALGATANAASGPPFDLEGGRVTALLLRPGAVGQVAAGMLASLPGVFVVALLAGGHWGGEWSGRTIRTLFVREGRRGRALAAKWFSLWVGSIICLLTCWGLLAIAGPLLASAYNLPSAEVPLWFGLGASLAAVAHAMVVLALFAAVGVAAGTVARGQLATMALTAGVMLIALLAARVGGGLAVWSPARFVQAWMRFNSNGYLPTNYWARFLQGSSGSEPIGLAGMAVCIAAAGGIALWRVRKDVNV